MPFKLKGLKCINDNIERQLYRNDKANSDMTDSIELFEKCIIHTEELNNQFRKKVRNKSSKRSEARLAKMREYNNLKRQNKTVQQREARLTKDNNAKKA